MLIKLLLALTIIVLILSPHVEHKDDIKTIDNDIILNEIIVIDTAIMGYYYNHSGKLPENLIDIELSNINLSKYSFNKISSNKFQLVIKNSYSKEVRSPNSDKDLPIVRYTSVN